MEPSPQLVSAIAEKITNKKRLRDEKAAKAARKAAKSAKAASSSSVPANVASSSVVEQRPSSSVAANTEFSSIVPATADKAAAQSFLERHEITIHAEDAPPPCHDMAAAPFPPPILQQLLSHFTEPTAVQGASWPLGIAGRDVLAIAKTGSGKTLAFLLPAIMRCAAERKAYPADLSPPAPFCLVMAPTRELALQTTEQARLFGAALGVRAVAVYGGSPKWGQARDLESGCEIVVATPGRMLDMLDLASSSGFGTGGKRLTTADGESVGTDGQVANGSNAGGDGGKGGGQGGDGMEGGTGGVYGGEGREGEGCAGGGCEGACGSGNMGGGGGNTPPEPGSPLPEPKSSPEEKSSP